jgi:hypothetical protein
VADLLVLDQAVLDCLVLGWDFDLHLVAEAEAEAEAEVVVPAVAVMLVLAQDLLLLEVVQQALEQVVRMQVAQGLLEVPQV